MKFLAKFDLKFAILFLMMSIFFGTTNSSWADSCPTAPICTYTASAGTSYTVNSGSTICVNSGTNYNSGTIYLNGGTIYVASGGTLDISRILPYAASTNVTISGATNASPIAITTSSNHNYITGQRVTIASVGGNTAANATWTITVTSATTFTLTGSTGNGAYTSGGTATLIPSFTVTGASNATPIVITTSASHGFVTGQSVGIQGIVGNEAANGTWTVTKVSATTFSLDGTTGSGAWSSGGLAQLVGTITNCGTLTGTPNNSVKWAGLTINNYSTNTLTYDPNGTGGLINNYASATLALSNFYGGSTLVNQAGNTGAITTSQISTSGGTRVYNYGTLNFSSTFSSNAGGASNHNIFTNYSTGTMNFNATASTGLNLTAYSDLNNYGNITFATNSGNEALLQNSNSTLNNYSTGTITATNGDYQNTGGTFNSYNSTTFKRFTINSASANINLYDYAFLKIGTLLTVNSANRLTYAGTGNCAFVDVSGGNGSNYTGSNTLTNSTGVKVCGRPGGITGSTFTISAVTNANPTTITSATHGFSVGQVIYLNLNGGTAGTLSTGYYEVDNVPSTTQVKLKNLTSPYTNVSSTTTTVSGSPNMALTNFGTALSFGDATAACSTAAANGSCTSPLPIELLTFNAKAKDDYVLVTWKTASEENNDHFTVLRSIDGINFEPIGIVKGAGTSSVSIDYSFVDNNPLAGTSYYKLQQTDFDGKTESFYIITVKFESDKNAWILYPNPTNGNELYIKFLGYVVDNDSPVFIEVFDLAGKEIFENTLKTYSQEESVLKTSNKLSKGVYLVEVTYNNEKRFERLIVK